MIFCNSPLLIEILTEELPANCLNRLAQGFAEAIIQQLKKDHLWVEQATWRVYATPRRFAVLISEVRAQAEDQLQQIRLLPQAIAFDHSGQPTQSLDKKLQALGLCYGDHLKIHCDQTHKHHMLFLEHQQPGICLSDVLSDYLAQALKQLPLPKTMHWGDKPWQFIRPVRNLLVRHGAELISAQVYDQVAQGSTLKHRVLGNEPLNIAHASTYEDSLQTLGKVIPHQGLRKKRIEQALATALDSLDISGAQYLDIHALLDEVCALVEWPEVHIGKFSAHYLDLPFECLTLTLRSHQRLFPVVDAQGKLTAYFLIVSNVPSSNGHNIVQGNQRVVQARLADAQFFYQQDLQQTLADRMEALHHVIYQQALGSQYARCQRLVHISKSLAMLIRLPGAQVKQAEQAAYLSKADLSTHMVREFPELQGIMGGYYAQAEGLAPEIAQAIQFHYHPRFSGDSLPSATVAICVALADKLEGLCGLFSIGLIPKADKDPYALRRQALGIIRMLGQLSVNISLKTLLEAGLAAFDSTASQAYAPLLDFIVGRIRYTYKSQAGQEQFNAVFPDSENGYLRQIPERLAALQTLQQRPGYAGLVQSSKRIQQILSQNTPITAKPFQPKYLDAPQALALHTQLMQIQPTIETLQQKEDWLGLFPYLESLVPSVDLFFEHVMVNVKDLNIRHQRIMLLQHVLSTFKSLADFSLLDKPHDQTNHS